MGFDVMIDDTLGHLTVTHDGSLTWDQLQAVKSAVWGDEARAIEVYPASTDVVNNGNFRHLWRLGKDDFCPDLLGPRAPDETLRARFERAWAEADA